MIKTIKIPNTPPYTGPKTELSDLKKLNFIYGPNGSGKTVLSRFLLNHPDSPQITWENDQALPIKVYNKDFIEKNFDQSGFIKGIFTLGEDNIESKKKIEEKKKDLSSINNDIHCFDKNEQEEKEKLTQMKNNFSEICWEKN